MALNERIGLIWSDRVNLRILWVCCCRCLRRFPRMERAAVGVSVRFPTGESLRKLIKKLGPVEKLRVSYGRLSDTEIEPRCHRIEPSQGNKGLLETRIGSIGEDLGVERCSV